jgi:hypothetical protein
MSYVYLSVYFRGCVDGQHRFFDNSTEEMLFKFLCSTIQDKLISDLGYVPDSESIVYYCTPAGGNYFFTVKYGSNQCLVLTSF